MNCLQGKVSVGTECFNKGKDVKAYVWSRFFCSGKKKQYWKLGSLVFAVSHGYLANTMPNIDPTEVDESSSWR